MKKIMIFILNIIPKRQIKKTFKKIETSNSPFKVLKNLNFN